jgi:hypothetical protein
MISDEASDSILVGIGDMPQQMITSVNVKIKTVPQQASQVDVELRIKTTQVQDAIHRLRKRLERFDWYKREILKRISQRSATMPLTHRCRADRMFENKHQTGKCSQTGVSSRKPTRWRRKRMQV